LRPRRRPRQRSTEPARTADGRARCGTRTFTIAASAVQSIALRVRRVDVRGASAPALSTPPPLAARGNAVDHAARTRHSHRVRQRGRLYRSTPTYIYVHLRRSCPSTLGAADARIRRTRIRDGR
jgi:hypothetical protein